MLYNLSGDGFAYTGSFFADNPFGIYAFSTQTGVGIYFNSINLTGNTLNQTNALSAGIVLGTGTTADVRDNAVVNNLGLLSTTGYGSVGIWLQTASSQLAVADYNDYFVNPTGSGVKAVGQIATTASTTIGAWQTATGQEAHSLSVNPQFVSATNLHLQLSSPLLGVGVTISGITTDIDGDLRQSPPDIGADEIVTYTVTYDGNTNTGGTAPVDPNSPYAANSTVTVLGQGTLTKTGYSFNGWNTLANGTGTAYAAGNTFTITANTTLFAQWTINSYTVTYDGNTNTGGTAPVDPNSPYAFGSTVTACGAGTLTKTGYTFSHWNTAANDSGTSYNPGDTFTMPAANVTLFAQWTINSYTVTYDGNTNTGGTAPVDPNSPYTFGSTVTVLGPGTLTKTGYTFAHWNTAANDSGTSYNPGDTFTMPAANVTLFAQWTVNSYTVTYDGNTNTGGTAPVDPNSPYAFGSTVTVLGPGTLTKTGYTFAHWNTAANDSGTSYNPGDTFTMPAANVTLFAQWTINSYTVTYDGNGNTGGTAPVDPNSPYTFGSTVTVLGPGTLTKTGYTFSHWNTAANDSGTSYNPGDTFTITANTTLFAQWTVNSYTVTYDGNGNTGGTAPVDPNSPYTFGSTVTVLGPGTLVKTGYTFSHWNTAANDSGTSYNPGNTFTMPAANVTLFAQWTINGPVTVSGSTGADGNYPSLTQAGGAFAAINAAGSQAGNNIVVTILADVLTEDGTNSLNNGGWTTLKINPVGARTDSGSVAGALINLNGASNVTIDGLNASGNSLTISNTDTGATTSTIRLINGATSDTITNCSVLGSSTGAVAAASGTILISTSTGGANSGNTISNNNIGPAGANLPSKGVTSLGSASPNNNTLNIIDNNNIFDFFNPGISVAGISLQANTTTVTVSNNRLYQTAPRTFTAAVSYTGISAAMGTGAGTATITGNKIGFGAANGTGTTTLSGNADTLEG